MRIVETQQQQLLMAQQQFAALSLQISQDRAEAKENREHRPKTITAAELARAATACPHDGNVEHGPQWWLGSKGVLRMLSQEAVTIAEGEDAPTTDQAAVNRVLFDFVLASIDQKKEAGLALVRKIMMQTPSMLDDGWRTRRLMMDIGKPMTSIEADAQYTKIYKFNFNIDASKSEIENTAHKITEEWNKLPADRKGHSRRNVEILIAAIPAVADEVRKQVQATLDNGEWFGHPAPDINHVCTLIYAQLSRWCVANPQASTSKQPLPFTGTMQALKDAAGQPKPCANCGKGGAKAHHPRECPHKCPTCKFKFCGSGHGKPCPLTAITMPPIEMVTQHDGRPLPPPLYNLIAKAHAAKHGTKASTNFMLYEGGEEEEKPMTCTIYGISYDDTFEVDGAMHAAYQHEQEIVHLLGGDATYRWEQILPVSESSYPSEEETQLMHEPTDIEPPPLLAMPVYTDDADMQDACMPAEGQADAFDAMLDTGSNVCVCNTRAIAPAHEWHAPHFSTLGGVNSDAPATIEAEARDVVMGMQALDGSTHTMVVPRLLHVPAAPGVVLSHAIMEDTLDWEIRYKLGYVALPSGGKVAISHKPRGMYHIHLTPHSGDQTYLMTSDVGYGNRTALLWNARLLLTPTALQLLPTTITGHGIAKVTPAMMRAIEVCEIRKQAQAKRGSHTTSKPASTASQPGGRLITDAWGPFPTPSAVFNCHIIHGGTDEASGKTFTQQAKTITTMGAASFVRGVDARMHAEGWDLKRVRVDNHASNTSPAFEERVNAARAQPVVVEYASAYDPERVGKQERMWGMIQPDATQMMLRPISRPNQSFYLHAMEHAAHLTDFRVQRGRLHTRGQLFNNRTQDASKVRVFLARGWVRNPNHKKGEAQSYKCVYVGFASMGFCTITEQGAYVISDDATFYEENMVLRGVMASASLVDSCTQTSNDLTTDFVTPTGTTADPIEAAREAIAQKRRATLPDASEWKRRLRDRTAQTNLILTADAAFTHLQQHGGDGIQARMQQGESTPDTHAQPGDECMQMAYANAETQGQTDCVDYLAAVLEPPACMAAQDKEVTFSGPQGEYTLVEPANTTSARKLTDAADWFDSESEHVAVLEESGVLRACGRDEAGGRCIYPAQMEYKLKKDQATAQLVKRKTRGCLGGHRWVGDEVRYFGNASALEVKMHIAMAAAAGDEIYKGDIPNAYPSAKWPIIDGVRLRVFMHMFRGHTRFDDAGRPLIYECMMNYWGSPIGGRTFGMDLRKHFTELGMTKVPSSIGSYILRREDSLCRISCITDDLLISGKKSNVDYLRIALEARTGIIGEYDPDSFVGWAVRRDRAACAITISVPRKIEELCELLGVTKDSKAVSPYVAATMLDLVVLEPLPAGTVRPKLTPEQVLCQRATGCCVYIAEVRPDILHPVHKCSRVMSFPPAVATLALLRAIAKFLLNTLNDGITYGGDPEHSNDSLTGVVALNDTFDMTRPAGKILAASSDATWGHVSNNSVATRMFTLYHGAIAASAHCIPSTQLNSNEAEVWSLSAAEAAGVHIINLAIEMGIPQVGPIKVRVDNSIAVKQAHEACFPKGSRHYARRIAYIQGNERDQIFVTSHVTTDHMPSDFLGKWVTVDKFQASRAHAMNLTAQIAMP